MDIFIKKLINRNIFDDIIEMPSYVITSLFCKTSRDDIQISIDRITNIPNIFNINIFQHMINTNIIINIRMKKEDEYFVITNIVDDIRAYCFNNLKQYATSIIYSEYPIHKQLKYNNSESKKALLMKKFISNVVNIYKEKKKELHEIKDSETLLNKISNLKFDFIPN